MPDHPTSASELLPLQADRLRFVFLWSPDADLGLVLGEQYFDFLKRFHHARSRASTWGEFVDGLGVHGAKYVALFVDSGGTIPNREDRLDALYGDKFVLDDAEFPVTQCAQESWQFYGREFPKGIDCGWYTTEYGMDFPVYPLSYYLEIKRQFVKKGHRMRDELATFPIVVADYAPARSDRQATTS